MFTMFLTGMPPHRVCGGCGGTRLSGCPALRVTRLLLPRRPAGGRT